MVFQNDLKKDVEYLLQDLLNHEQIKKMNQFIQHGNVSTYEHSLNVAIMSYIISKKMHLLINEKELLTGALLHDFYLYDWHEGRFKKRDGKLHAFSHPKTALLNAKRYFELNKKEENIIKSHMFPLTFWDIPKSKEAFIVNISDKICAWSETFEEGLYTGFMTFLNKKQKLDKLEENF